MRPMPLLLSLPFMAALGAHAEPVAGLYRAETVVTGTEEPERTRGFRVGLADVVVKRTGDIGLARDARLAALMERPHDLVETFEYEDRMKNLPVRDEQGTRQRPHFLRIAFKAAALDEALARLGIPLWGEDRPVVAVWLGVRTATGGFLLTRTGRDFGQRIVLDETARRRGIPVRLPEEGGPAGFDAVAGDRVEAMERASSGADARLSGVLEATETGYWSIVWRPRWQERTHMWERTGVSFDVAIQEGLETTAGILGAASRE